MSIQACNFWCVHFYCGSSHTGEDCGSCSLFMQCHSCVLKTHDPNVSCEDYAYYITHGFPEDEE